MEESKKTLLKKLADSQLTDAKILEETREKLENELSSAKNSADKQLNETKAAYEQELRENVEALEATPPLTHNS